MPEKEMLAVCSRRCVPIGKEQVPIMVGLLRWDVLPGKNVVDISSPLFSECANHHQDHTFHNAFDLYDVGDDVSSDMFRKGFLALADNNTKGRLVLHSERALAERLEQYRFLESGGRRSG